jgi:hypothetical protein
MSKRRISGATKPYQLRQLLELVERHAPRLEEDQ